MMTQSEIADAIDTNDDNRITISEVASQQQLVFDCESTYYNSWNYALFSVLGSGFVALTCVMTMLVRARVRKRDQIPVTLCAGLDDCVCAIVCTPCVQCQLLRHEGLGDGIYDVTSADGAPADGSGFQQLAA